MTRSKRIALASALAITCLGIGVSSASATYHANKISEVGNGGSGDFIELQSYAAGQNLVAGRFIAIYNGGDNYFSGPFMLPSNVSNGQSQRTILIGAPGVTPTPDFVFAGLSIPSQGTACFLDNLGADTSAAGEADDVGVDCVSFGEAYAGAPSPSGAALGDVPVTRSAIRSKARGCDTLLEAGDDTNSSLADFRIGFRTPRPNRVAPTERPCIPCTGIKATHVGTNGPDVLVGTPNRDVFSALGGNDRAVGLGGRDLFCMGGGRDKAKGGGGRDHIRGQAGPDKLIGGASGDKLIGGGSKDKLIGKGGNDVCKGGPRSDKAKSCETEKSI